VRKFVHNNIIRKAHGDSRDKGGQEGTESGCLHKCISSWISRQKVMTSSSPIRPGKPLGKDQLR